jgi:hypothetical protein
MTAAFRGFTVAVQANAGILPILFPPTNVNFGVHQSRHHSTISLVLLTASVNNQYKYPRTLKAYQSFLCICRIFVALWEIHSAIVPGYFLNVSAIILCIPIE